MLCICDIYIYSMIIGNYGGEIWRNHILYYIPMISALFPYIYI